MRRECLLALFCVLLSEPLVAQQAEVCPVCWRARPLDRCRVMILTDFGFHVQSATIAGEGGARVTADWGALVNVGAHTAVGATFFISCDGTDRLLLGPSVRYRRWLGPTQSIELALGTPLYGSGYETMLSPYGLIKYNPAHWVGFAVRPELRRVTSTDFGSGGLSEVTRSRFVLSAGGVELASRDGARRGRRGCGYTSAATLSPRSGGKRAARSQRCKPCSGTGPSQ